MAQTNEAESGQPQGSCKPVGLDLVLPPLDSIPHQPPKVDPWVHWRTTLKNPRLVLAPMVDGSDLAFRRLARRYGTHLAFTPMLHSYVVHSYYIYIALLHASQVILFAICLKNHPDKFL